MPLASWQDTKQTLHRFCQVIGKLRLAASARRNHWWNVPFHRTGRASPPDPWARPTTTRASVSTWTSSTTSCASPPGRPGGDVPLQGQSVASFPDQTLQALAGLGITVAITHPHPFDLPDADRPFADDTTHAGYDPAWVGRYWRVLSQVNLVLEQCVAALVFMARTSTPSSPLPAQELGCGSASTCWRRLDEWTRAGVFDQLQALLLDELGAAGRIDLERVSVDSFSLRAVKR